MFFENNDVECWEIFPEWNKEKIEEKSEEIGLPSDTIENRWAIFANILGAENGLDVFECTSMASVISGFMAGLPVSAGTEMYYDEERIDNAVIDKLNSIDRSIDEVEVRRELVDFILDLYKNDLRRFEYKDEQLGVRLSRRELVRFMEVPGRNKTDKLRFLVDFYWDNV